MKRAFTRAPPKGDAAPTDGDQKAVAATTGDKVMDDGAADDSAAPTIAEGK